MKLSLIWSQIRLQDEFCVSLSYRIGSYLKKKNEIIILQWLYKLIKLTHLNIYSNNCTQYVISKAIKEYIFFGNKIYNE